MNKSENNTTYYRCGYYTLDGVYKIYGLFEEQLDR